MRSTCSQRTRASEVLPCRSAAKKSKGRFPRPIIDQYVKSGGGNVLGAPIGTFQALQHRAADMYAEVELCRSAMLLAAIQVESADPEERKAEVSAAKLQLSAGGWYIQENAIQLHGGIGVTDEQDEGLFFKRVRVLQALFGDADHHVDRFQRLARFDG